MYRYTKGTKKLNSLRRRIRAVQGGTSAGKTISILLLLIDLSQTDEKPTVTSIVSESFPHLRRGAMKDFLDILKSHDMYDDERWNRTEYFYEFENGSRIEFFSADQPSKVRGPRRERLFINEANNIPYEAFDQLEVRTKEFVFLDWNPVSEFWFYTDVLGKRDDVDHLTLTYLDNEALDQQIVRSIEQRKENKSWWRVYGEGLLGEAEGRVYSNWQVIDDVPHMARLERYGLDFGYSQDPSACVGVYRYDGGFVLDEAFYQLGMQNSAIADTLSNLQKALVIADSSEPKSIDELKLRGVNVVGCEKGPDSVRNGIQVVQDQKIMVTKRSLNILKEYRSLMWRKDRDGKYVSPNVPEDGNDHALDAVRYAITSIVKKPVFVMPAPTPAPKRYYPELGM